MLEAVSTGDIVGRGIGGSSWNLVSRGADRKGEVARQRLGSGNRRNLGLGAGGTGDMTI